MATSTSTLAASAGYRPDIDGLRAIAVLRRGFAQSPELGRGLRLTVLFAMIGAVGRLIIPVLIQQVIEVYEAGLEGTWAYGSEGRQESLRRIFGLQAYLFRSLVLGQRRDYVGMQG